MIRLLVYVCFIFCPLLMMAQNNTSQKGANYFQVDERKLIETKWKYTYTLHLESNTIIHRAENAYDYYLFFRYNYIYQQYLNGKYTRGNWNLKEDILSYKFKNIPKFTIAKINKQILVLEFTQVNSRGTYQYHFVRVATKDAPFVKPPNELPDVNVEAIKSKEEKKWWVFNKTKKRKRKKKEKKEKGEKLEPYINIEVVGGGFYGGINPTIRDYIHIKNNGRLIKEYKNIENGLVITKRDIPRAELEKFITYIISQNFFEMKRIYDCESELCQKRKKIKPVPIPLRLAITYKDRRKVITIPIFGKDNQNIQYISYPPALDKIIAGIQKFSYRIDPS